MQVGTTKDQRLYNKPSAAVHPGAAGTLIQYNTLQLAILADYKTYLALVHKLQDTTLHSFQSCSNNYSILDMQTPVD